MTDFQALNTAYTGLRAAQRALDTIGNNVANVATRGYTRQRVDTGARPAWESAEGWVGAGVDVAGLSRQRDAFLDARARGELSTLAGLDARASRLQQAESLVGQLDGALTDDLSALFAAFEDLSLTPDSAAARQVVLARLDSTTSRFRALSQGLEDLRAATVEDLRRATTDINGALRQVADLNRAIAEASLGGRQPNDLLDTRDRLIDDLSSRLGVQVTPTDDGTLRLSLGGITLVDGARASEVTANADGTLQHPAGTIVPGGELGGIRTFLTTDLPAVLGDLDGLALALRDAINGTNAAGFSAAGTPGGALLTATSARDLAATTDPSRIATSLTDPPSRFDGRNAAALAGLRTAAGPDGRTLQARTGDLLVDLGARVADITGRADRQAVVASATSTARESAHGVDIDEEMVNLITYQRALEAASRVMTSIDEALDVIVNRTGLVGR